MKHEYWRFAGALAVGAAMVAGLARARRRA